MKRVIVPFLVLLAVPAFQSVPAAGQEIVDEPICFTVRNDAPYTVYGNFATDYYTDTDGTRARHRSNFRLEEAGAKDEQGYPADRAEFCSYGPFFEGRQLELVLRTLIPVFSCKTSVEKGELVIRGFRRPEGGAKTWAECL